MAKSKLGIYVISLSGVDVVAYVRRALPRVILSMDHNLETWRQVQAISPNTFILGRHYLDDGDQLYFDNPEVRAAELFVRMRPDMEKMRGVYAAWMGYNETVIKNETEARRLSRFYAQWGKLMREAGFQSAAYSFATGTPAAGFPNPDGDGSEPNFWQFLTQGLRECDYLALHEYSAPHMQDLQGFLMLRYRRVWELLPEEARKPIIISETGIDGGVIPGGSMAQKGWTFFTNEDGYLSQLQWYDDHLLADDFVVGATIFSLNPWGIQGSFAISGAEKIRDYIGAGGPPPPPDGPPTQTLEQAVLETAATVPWMPVNNTAALWRYAKQNGLQDQQTDEIHFTYGGADYIAQVFNLGIVYVKVGDWGNIKVIPK
ncbi:MAG: hypothetical protein IT331_14040 [Anaerolineae bacterium]|nr:hypothetical protein [Anaerolineae bacterium]